MPDQDTITTIPEPTGGPATNADQAVAQGEFSEGNLAKAFEKVFPASAAPRKSATPAPPVAPVAPVPPVAPKASEVPAAPVAPIPSVPPPAEDKPILPNELFGEIPTTPKEAAPDATLGIEEIDAPPEVQASPEAFKNWKELRSAYKQLKTELAETKKKAEAGPPLDEGFKARMEQLEQENKSFKERQYAIDLQSDPEYQKVFVHGRRQIVDTAVDIVKQAGLEPQDFARATELNGRARTEAFDEILESITSTTLKGELAGEISKLNSLDRSKSQTLANSKDVVEKLQQNRRAQEFKALQEHEKFMDETFDTVWDRLANKSKIGFLQKIEGNNDWNKNVDVIQQRARDIAKNSTDYAQLEGTIILGSAFPDVYNAAVALNRENQGLKKIIAEYKASEPSLNGGRTGDTAVSTRPDKKLSFAEAVAQSSGLPG